MTKATVYCTKLETEAEALKRAPYPGELGKRILAEISKPAWQQWIQRQTMLINEYRLNLTEAEARKFLEEQMQSFLFEGGDDAPPGFVPEKPKSNKDNDN